MPQGGSFLLYEGAQSGEDFWVKAERLYYTALIGYIYYEAPEEEKNIITLLDMINASDTREDDEDYKNPVDLMFDRLEDRTSAETGDTQKDFSFRYSQRFFNDRVQIVIGGKVSTGANATNDAESFIDNISLEYRIDGRVSLRLVGARPGCHT